MTAPAHLPIRRVLERITTEPGVQPLRIFPVLLPMWAVEVRTRILDAQPYAVFDQHLSQAVAGTGLDEPARLAAFFGVEEPLVTRALRFLEAVGHLRREGSRAVLTDLGRKSVADGCRYVVKEDRQRLYFDGFTSRPMPRTHYAGAEWFDDTDVRLADRTVFRQVGTVSSFRLEAIQELEHRADRERFNLPTALTAVEPLEIRPGWLPAYVVDCVAGLQVFVKAIDGPDPYLADVVTPFLRNVLAAEPAANDVAEWRTWLAGRGIAEATIVRLPNRVLRATVPASVFGASMPWTRLGSFETRPPSFLQIWCRDERARRQAVLVRAGAVIASGSVRGRAEVDRWLTDFAARLEVSPPDFAELQRYAEGEERPGLLEALERLALETTYR